MHSVYGRAGSSLRTPIDAAFDAVSATWDEENDEGDNGYGHGDRPNYDFDRLEPQAVRALQELAKEVAAAERLAAFAPPRLSRRERRDLLYGRSPLSTVDERHHHRRNSGAEALAPPGQLVAASPHPTNGPPRHLAMDLVGAAAA